MAEFIRWINEGPPARWDPVIRAIVAHYHVVDIHPFGDGNGRTSRAVEAFLLCRAGVNALGYYSPASHYSHHRDNYIQQLNNARLRRDLTPFVAFAIEGLATELQAIQDEALR